MKRFCRFDLSGYVKAKSLCWFLALASIGFGDTPPKPRSVPEQKVKPEPQPTVPAKPGDTIILWGTGFGPTSPSAPPGVVVPGGTTYNTSSAVTVTVGRAAATFYGAALTPGDVGLYQVAIQIPAGLANGDYPVVAMVAGAQSPSATLITVQN
jgi:uncharacterized protein (TIGR03437 family)